MNILVSFMLILLSPILFIFGILFLIFEKLFRFIYQSIISIFLFIFVLDCIFFKYTWSNFFLQIFY